LESYLFITRVQIYEMPLQLLEDKVFEG